MNRTICSLSSAKPAEGAAKPRLSVRFVGRDFIEVVPAKDEAEAMSLLLSAGIRPEVGFAEIMNSTKGNT